MGSQVRVLLRPPSALTIGAASELVRNDEFAFLYAKTHPVAALIPRIPQEYTVGPASWAGFVCKLFVSATPGFQFPWIFPDLPCTACTACNPCNSCNPCTDRKWLSACKGKKSLLLWAFRHGIIYLVFYDFVEMRRVIQGQSIQRMFI